MSAFPARFSRSATAALVLVLAAPAAATAQAMADAAAPESGADAFELGVAEIMRGPELVGSPPRAVRWTDDGEWVYFRWKPGGLDWHEDASLYRVREGGGEPERLSDEEADSVGPLLAGGDISAEGDARVVSYDGDLYLIDRESLETRRLTETDAAERSPIFGDDGRTIYFVRDDNVFAFALDRGEVRQLTDIRSGSPPRDEEPEGHEAYLRDQQRELFEHIRREAEEREEREAEREAREAEEPETVWIENGERLFGIEVEPGARWALLAAGRPAEDPPTMVPDWVTESGYTEERRTRSKVGGARSESRMGLLTIETGEVEWLELVPDSGHAAAPAGDDYGDADRLLANVDFLGWNDQGTLGLVAAVGYAFKDQWLYTVDARTAELTLVARDHDEAWIGGPCSTWTSSSCAGWMPDGESVWFVSERDGYSHLYTVGIDGGGAEQLTRGEWEVHSVDLSPDEDRFLMTTSEGSPFE
ncbi:MAG: DPP IV N-terminal domain-containing protein, partial [Gemmatimonadota bacterium]